MPSLEHAAPSAPVTGRELRLMVRAIVAETPADSTVALKVVVPSFDDQALYEVPAGQWTGTPTAGDVVLLGFDESGDEWIVGGLGGEAGPAGPQGEQGEQGPQGDTGPTGPALNPIWSAWTPTLSGTGTAKGNGTATGRYCQIGKVVHFRFWFKLGSTSSIGSGGLTFDLPATAVAQPGVGFEPLGLAYLLDSGTANYIGTCVFAGTTTATVHVINAAGTFAGPNTLSATVPITWTTNDEIMVQGTYEAA